MNQTLEFLTLNPLVQGVLAAIFIAVTLAAVMAVVWDTVSTRLRQNRVIASVHPSLRAMVKKESIPSCAAHIGMAVTFASVALLVMVPILREVAEGGPYKMQTISIDSRATVIVVR